MINIQLHATDKNWRILLEDGTNILLGIGGPEGKAIKYTKEQIPVIAEMLARAFNAGREFQAKRIHTALNYRSDR